MVKKHYFINKYYFENNCFSIRKKKYFQNNTKNKNSFLNFNKTEGEKILIQKVSEIFLSLGCRESAPPPITEDAAVVIIWRLREANASCIVFGVNVIDINCLSCVGHVEDFL